MLNAIVAGAVVTGLGAAGLRRLVARRRRRYKTRPIVDFESVRQNMRTGDILLFHKTSRSGFVDSFELDLLSPLVFGENEFRHSGIVVRKEGEIYVMECADRFHSGHTEATYLTAGNGIRLVALEILLAAYNRDNGDPHFGIKHISEEIPVERVYATLEEFGAVDYLKMHKSASMFLSNALLPRSVHGRFASSCENEMMCSEFVHRILNRCGVLKDYPSKVFAPYYIENPRVFQKLEQVPYSEIIRFKYRN